METQLNITVLKHNEGYQVVEPAFHSEENLSAFELSYLKIDNRYLLLCECSFKDFVRTGSRRKDLSEIAFGIALDKNEALLRLRERAINEAKELAQQRRYCLIIEC